jgi:hypothetical protein
MTIPYPPPRPDNVHHVYVFQADYGLKMTKSGVCPPPPILTTALTEIEGFQRPTLASNSKLCESTRRILQSNIPTAAWTRRLGNVANYAR